jgi:hypothetical protein
MIEEDPLGWALLVFGIGYPVRFVLYVKRRKGREVKIPKSRG